MEAGSHCLRTFHRPTQSARRGSSRTTARELSISNENEPCLEKRVPLIKLHERVGGLPIHVPFDGDFIHSGAKCATQHLARVGVPCVRQQVPSAASQPPTRAGMTVNSAPSMSTFISTCRRQYVHTSAQFKQTEGGWLASPPCLGPAMYPSGGSRCSLESSRPANHHHHHYPHSGAVSAAAIAVEPGRLSARSPES